jgi:hypothetical protein
MPTRRGVNAKAAKINASEMTFALEQNRDAAMLGISGHADNVQV